MDDRIKRLYEMFSRVLNFMQINAADFQDIPFVAATVAKLKTEVETLSGLGVQKVSTTSAVKDMTISRGDAREDLYDALKDIVGLWKSLADENSGAENKFRIPFNKSDQNLIAAGKSFAEEAEPVKSIFTDHGMPTNFIIDLQTKVTAFEDSVNLYEQKYGERVGTNAAFSEPARRAKLLIGKLAPAVKRKYRSRPQKLAEWLVASHTERAVKPAPSTENKTIG